MRREREISENELTIVFLGARHPHIFHRVEVLKKYPLIKVEGFYEENDKTADRFATKTGYTRISSIKDLEYIRPDLTIVEMMDDETPKYALLAAPFTKALLLEKCAVPNYETAVRLSTELSGYQVHVEHGYELHYLEVIEECKKILDSGALGQITLAHFHGGCPLGCGTEIWQSNPECMGGVVYTEGSHMIELMLYLIGAPDKVCGRIRKLPKGEWVEADMVTRDMFLSAMPLKVRVGDMFYEDVGAAIFEYKNCLATLDITAWESTGWVKGWFMEFYGTNGTLTVRPYPSILELELRKQKNGYGQGIDKKEIPGITKDGYTLMRDAYRKQFDKVFSMLRSGIPSDQSGMQIITDIAKICQALYENT